MLFGCYDNKVDAKGRVAIPVKFRTDLGESFMVCPHILGKPCLCLYSMEQWKLFVEKIESFPTTKIGDAKRRLYSNAFNVEYDSQGRILLPAVLRKSISLGSEAHIVGMNSYAEIWDIEEWVVEDAKLSNESVASAFEGLGF